MSERTTDIRATLVELAKSATSGLGSWAVYGAPRVGQAAYAVPCAVIGPRSPYRTPAGPVEAVALRVTLMVATANVNALDALDDALDAVIAALHATSLELAIVSVTSIGPADNAGAEVLAAIIDLDIDRRT
jgi:hypothetical protein